MNPAVAATISGSGGALVGFVLRAPFDTYMTRLRDRRLKQEQVEIALTKMRYRLVTIKIACELVPPNADHFDESILGPYKTVRDEICYLGAEKDEYHNVTNHPDPTIEIGLQRILVKHDLAAIDAMLQANSKRVGCA